MQAEGPEFIYLQRSFSGCPRPHPPELARLDAGKRLEHPVNLARLTFNVDLMAEHIGNQDYALDCYEMQTTEP